MTLKVNGKVWQNATTGDMIFSFAEIISFASQFMTLEPGDVSPRARSSGVGDASGTYLKAGDVMDGVGRGHRHARHPGRCGRRRRGLTRPT